MNHTIWFTNNFVEIYLLNLTHDYGSFYICFISRLDHIYWEWNERFNIAICKCLVLNWANMSNFHPLEFVGRGCGTQFQVSENYFFFDLSG